MSYVFRNLGIIIFPAFTFFLSCAGGGSNPADTGDKFGMIEIRARVINAQLAKAAGADGTARTAAERLVIEISGADLAPTRIESAIDFSRPTIVDTVKSVPVGRNRRIEIWAIDGNGFMTHIDSSESRMVNIEAAAVTPVFATLIPAAGSIYLQFSGLSTLYSSIHANFTDMDGIIVAENSANRSTHMTLNLDNIPHLTHGVLRVYVIGASGDTLHVATNELTFNARGDNGVDLQFIDNNGMVKADITFYEPGVTVGWYHFGNDVSSVEETGELIITEIMWNSSNDNYVEVYNPSSEPFSGVLIIDVDVGISGGASRGFEGVTIAPRGYFVIGRREMPHVDVFTPTTGGLPITTTGNWISIKRGDGTVIDRVIMPGTGAQSTALGWPTMSSTVRRSIELSRDKYDAIENNYGKNWRLTESTEPLSGTTTAQAQYGTPGY